MTRADISWQVGDHALMFGLDSETNTATNFTINSGGVYWLLDPTNTYNVCSPAECPRGSNFRKRTYASGGAFETTSDAFYIQDTWDINDNWTVELGIRSESFKNLNGEGNVFVEIKDQIAPRLSAVWDPKGDGTSKVFFNYGEYYLPIAANTNIRMAGGETYIHEYFDWDGVSVDADNAPTNVAATPYDTIVFGNGEVPDTSSVTDKNIEPMYQSEFILGYSRYLDSGVELGIKGIYRNLETTIEDVAIDAAVNAYYAANGWDTIPGDELDCDHGAGPVDCDSTDYFTGFHQYVLTTPGQDMTVFIPEQDETIDLAAAALGYPKAERQYAALELSYTRPFDDRWSASASYTWAHSWGNHEGYVQSDIGQDDAGITQNFDQPGLTDYSNGNLPNDRRHTVKGYGSYQLENGLRFGGSVMWQSGRPKSCFGVHPTDVFAADYGAFSFYCNGQPAPRGTAGTTPSTLNVDINAQYVMQLGKTDVLLSMDVFNVFNGQKPTVYNEIAETFAGAPDEDYGKIRQYQQPRWLRLSARVAF